MISSVRLPRSAKLLPSASNSARRPSDADGDGQAAVAEGVEAGQRVRQPQRGVVRRGDLAADPDPLGDGRGGGEGQQRVVHVRRRVGLPDRERDVVVHPHVAEAELLGLDRGPCDRPGARRVPELGQRDGDVHGHASRNLLCVSMELEQVDVVSDGPVTRVVLDRPERRNALSLDLMREVIAVLERASRRLRGRRARSRRTRVLRRARPRRDGGARRRVLRRAVRRLHRHDAAAARAAAAGDRAGAGRRDRGRLPARRRLRPRGRGRHRHLRHARRAHRPLLLHADGAARPRHRPQARARDAAHRRAGRRGRRRSPGVW